MPSQPIRIKSTSQELKYKGLYFQFNKIKPYVKGFVQQSYLDRFVIHRKFNKVSGEIEYKYAWDSLLHELNKDGFLVVILEFILEDEGI